MQEIFLGISYVNVKFSSESIEPYNSKLLLIPTISSVSLLPHFLKNKISFVGS